MMYLLVLFLHSQTLFASGLRLPPSVVGATKASMVKKVVLNGRELCPEDRPKAQEEQLFLNHTVRLRFGSNRHHCSGVLLSNLEVMTARHCLKQLKSTDPEDHLRIQFFNPKTRAYEDREVQQRSPHSSKDVALLVLSDPVGHIKKPIPRGPCPVSEPAEVLGHGIESRNSTSSCLKSATYTLQSGHHELIVSKAVRDSDGNPYGQACRGDSGGPLFCKTSSGWVLGGINVAIMAEDEKLLGEMEKAVDEKRADVADYCKVGQYLKSIPSSETVIESLRKGLPSANSTREPAAR